MKLEVIAPDETRVMIITYVFNSDSYGGMSLGSKALVAEDLFEGAEIELKTEVEENNETS